MLPCCLTCRSNWRSEVCVSGGPLALDLMRVFRCFSAHFSARHCINFLNVAVKRLFATFGDVCAENSTCLGLSFPFSSNSSNPIISVSSWFAGILDSADGGSVIFADLSDRMVSEVPIIDVPAYRNETFLGDLRARTMIVQLTMKGWFPGNCRLSGAIGLIDGGVSTAAK